MVVVKIKVGEIWVCKEISKLVGFAWHILTFEEESYKSIKMAIVRCGWSV
jgi:hypothetical protein